MQVITMSKHEVVSSPQIVRDLDPGFLRPSDFLVMFPLNESFRLLPSLLSIVSVYKRSQTLPGASK